MRGVQARCRLGLRAGASARLVLVLLALSAFVPFAGGQEKLDARTLDQKLIADAKVGSEVMANLVHLSDVIGPRLTGSAALKRANEWTAEKMKSYGLSNVQLEPWELPVGWERGMAYARIIEPDNGRTLTMASMGWSPGTNGRIEGDVVVISARRPEDLKAYEGKLKNAIVLRGPPANVRPITDLSSPIDRFGPGAQGDKPGDGGRKPDEKPRDGEKAAAKPGDNPDKPAGFDTRPGGGFRSMMALRQEMGELFRKEGVAAILVDAGKPHGLLNMSGGWSGRDRVSAPDPVPTLFVTHDHYALLHRLASRPSPTRTRMEIEVHNKFIPGPLTVYNTVGEIRGSEKPDEFVVLGAHLDSWDLAQGTTDNGTGTAVVLETARLLAKCGVKPKRTIRFVLFSGEEQGLHGSRAYVQRHKEEMAKTSVCLVHDIGTGKVIGISLQGRDVLKPLLESELAELKSLGVKELSTRSMGGSDHMAFEQGGVPGLFFQQEAGEYRLTHHSQSDTLDKAREADVIQGAQVMAVAAMRVANLDQLLPREKKAGGKPGEKPPAAAKP